MCASIPLSYDGNGYLVLHHQLNQDQDRESGSLFRTSREQKLQTDVFIINETEYL